jgi:4-hydroxy-3-methylbut-2-enyl diphosphate reductase
MEIMNPMEGKAYRLAEPRGFCSGVKAAIETVERALVEGPLPVCVLHEIVHNEHVVESLARRGVRFVGEPEDAPSGATLIFSAHGVSGEVEARARALPLKVVDATCPLVKRLQRRAVELEAEGNSIILLGHAGHNEVIGVLGRLTRPAQLVSKLEDIESLKIPDGPCACLTQTTLSADDVASLLAALRLRIPALIEGGGVCYATKDRQAAVKELARTCDTIIIIGSKKSSNSLRLKEVAEASGARALLVASAAEVPASVFEDAKEIGVGAGASAPERLVSELVESLESKSFRRV